MDHIVSGCSKLAEKECKRTHDNLGKIIHWKFARKCNFEAGDKCYEHEPKSVLENEDYKFFFKKKDKQIHKASNNGDMKSVAVKHPKTASDFLKPIEQSNIITHDLETVKKTDIFDIELATIEHQKTSNKLSRFIKKSKIITQQPKQHKFVQSKAADCMLKLDIKYFS